MKSNQPAQEVTRALRLDFFPSSPQSSRLDVAKGFSVQLVTSSKAAQHPHPQQVFIQCDC
jgi:hypothetical protein